MLGMNQTKPQRRTRAKVPSAVLFAGRLVRAWAAEGGGGVQVETVATYRVYPNRCWDLRYANGFGRLRAGLRVVHFGSWTSCTKGLGSSLVMYIDHR